MMCIFLRACSHSNTTKGAETSQIFNIVRENISYISALFRTRERKMFKIEESSSRKIAILFSKWRISHSLSRYGKFFFIDAFHIKASCDMEYVSQ